MKAVMIHRMHDIQYTELLSMSPSITTICNYDDCESSSDSVMQMLVSEGLSHTGAPKPINASRTHIEFFTEYVRINVYWVELQ